MTSGVGAKLSDEGGITPFVAVEEVTAVPPDVVKFPLPEETETSALGLGGITPESLVDDVTAVPPEMVRLPVPPVEEGTETVSLADGTTEPVLAGGITPESPVEPEAKVLPLVANVAPPDATETERTTVTFAEGKGGMTPDAPVLVIVAVEPDVDKFDEPPTVTVIVGSVLGATLEFETACMEREAAVLAPVPMIGVMTPLSPVEVDVKVLPAVVTLPLP